jgi:hypothetical protein
MFWKIPKIIAVTIFFFSITFFIQTNVNAQQALSKKHFPEKPYAYLPRIDFGAYRLNGSNANTATVLETLVPLYQRPNILTFSDLRYYNQPGAPWEGNVAFGVRGLNANHKIFGVYGSLDRFRSQSKRYFSQAMIGFELWFNRLFLGGNGYIAINPKAYSANAFNTASLVPTSTSDIYNIIYANGSEQILPGVDALLGYDFTNHLTIYGGGYYFHKTDVPTVFGPKLRATYTWYSRSRSRLFGIFDRIRLEAQMTHDNVRKTDWYVGIRVGINLGHNRSTLTRLQQHMVDMIRRDENVIDVQYTETQSNFLTNAAGSKVTVGLPTSYADFATEAEGTTGVDIIGVNGILTAASGDTQSLDIVRDLVINGGTYSFAVFGRPYSVVMGNEGEISVENSSDYLLNVQSSSNIDLEQMTFENKAGPVLQTESSSTGALTIDQTVFKGVTDASNALVTLDGDSDVLIRQATFNFDSSSTGGSGLDLLGSGGLVTLAGNINSNLDIQDAYVISMEGDDNLTISNATMTNTGQGGILDVELSTTGHLSILNSTLQGNGTTPIVKLEDTDNPTLKNVTIINTNTTNSEPLIEIASTANININTAELMLENSGLGDSIEEDGDLTIENSTITETTGEPVIHIPSGEEATVSVSNSTITNLGAGCIFRIAMGAKVNLTISDSNLVASGATATMILGSSDSMSSTTLTNVNLTNSGGGALIEHTGTAPLTLNTFLGLTQTGTGDGIVLANTAMMSPHTLTLDNITIQGDLDGNLIDLPDGSTESLMIGNNVSITNADTGNLIYHEGTGALTIDSGATVTLSHTGASISGDGIVLANTSMMSPHTLSLDNVTLAGGMNGKLVSTLAGSTESISLGNNTTLSNTGTGDLIYHEGSGSFTIDSGASLSLSHTNNGDGIVLANADTMMSAQTLDLSNVTITGSMAGAFIVVPSSSTTSVIIQNSSALTNSGSGNILNTASSSMSADLTITDSSLETSSSGDVLILGGSGDVSISGTTTLTSSTGNLMSVEGATGDISLTGISGTPIELETSGFALITDGSSFGDTTIGYVESNAPFDFKLSDDSAQGQVTFDNNELTIGNATAIDSSVVNDFASIIFSSNDDSQAFTVSSFSNNTLNVTRTDDNDTYGLYASGTTSSPITFSSGIKDNMITMDNSTAPGSRNSIFIGSFNRNVTLNDNFENNTIDVSGLAGSSLGSRQGTIGLYTLESFVINSSASMRNNTFNTENDRSSGDGAAWYAGGTVSIAGNLGGAAASDGNTFTSSGNAANGYGVWARDSFGVSGDISYNTFEASSNGATSDAFSSDSSATITIGGNFENNTLTASSNTGSGLAWDMGGALSMSTGNFTNNTLTASSNTSNGFGWESTGTVNIGGDFSDNNFTASSNVSGTGYAWQSESASTVTIGGNVTNNRLTANSNGNDGYGWDAGATIAITGNFGGSSTTDFNIFTATGNTDDAYGWETSGTVTIDGDFCGADASHQNQFIADSNQNGYGWQSENTVSVDGKFSYNTFQASSNTGASYGWQSSVSSGNSLEVTGGDFSYNTFTVSLNTGGTSYGWQNNKPILINNGAFAYNSVWSEKRLGL